MDPFWISEIEDRKGEKVLYINPLPEKCCTFDCVFCPIEERTINKTEQSFFFEGTKAMLEKLEVILKENKVDKIYILPDGEGLANAELPAIILLAKQAGCKLRIITNGYILNHPLYKDIMLQCDEVIGELMTVREEDFQRLQRPLEGYTLQDYVNNMHQFRKAFKGMFDLSITLLKNYSDDKQALDFFKSAVCLLKPSNIYVETPEEGKLKQAFGVEQEIVDKFKSELEACIR